MGTILEIVIWSIFQAVARLTFSHWFLHRLLIVKLPNRQRTPSFLILDGLWTLINVKKNVEFRNFDWKFLFLTQHQNTRVRIFSEIQ